MIIERLDLKAYGGFSDSSLDLSAGPYRFHLIYGANESGKSTSLRAITSLLYGMSTRIEDAYIHPAAKLRVGGRLRGDNDQTIECLRRRGRVKTLRQLNDKDVIDDSVIEDMLGGIDEETFKRQFGLSYEELIAGGSAILSGGGDLGAILFAAGAGIGRLNEIQTQLTADSDKLFKRGGKNAAINQALRRFDEQNKKLRELQVAPVEFQRLQSEYEEKRGAVRDMETALTDTASRLNRIVAYRNALAIAPKWNVISSELNELHDAPLLDQAFKERRRDLTEQHGRRTQTVAELNKQLSELTKSLDDLASDKDVAMHAAAIDELFENRGSIQKAREDRVGLVRLRDKIDRAMIDTLRELAVEIPDEENDEQIKAVETSVRQLELTDATRHTINSLAQSFGAMIQQRDLAEQDVATIERKLDIVETEIQETAAPGDPEFLRSTIESVGSPESRFDAVVQQSNNVERLEQKSSELLQRLSGFSGTAVQASKLKLPALRRIEEITRRLEAADDALAAAKSKLEQLDLDREQTSLRLRKEQMAEALPTLSELNQARQVRNDSVDQLSESASKGNLARKDIDRLRNDILRADQLVDIIRMHGEAVHRRAADQAKLDLLEEQIVQQQAAVESALEESSDAQDQWQAIWQQIDVVADTPSRMQRWVADHEQLVDCVRQRQSESRRLQKLEDEIAIACRRLHEAVATSTCAAEPPSRGGGLFDREESQDDLLRLYDEASALSRSMTEGKRQYDQLCEKRDGLKEELPEAQSRAESSRAQAQRWEENWQKATSAFVDAPNRSPEVVVSLLSKIDTLCDQRKERNILARRIRSIDEDDDRYRDKVLRTMKKLEFDAASSIENDGDVWGIVQTLYDRLQHERSQSNHRDSLSEQVAKTKQEISTAQRQVEELDGMLAKLCEEAGCEETSELIGVERLSDQKRERQASLDSVEDQLRILAAGVDLHEFVRSTLEQDAGALDVEIETLELRQNELREQIASANQEVGAIRRDLERIDGSAEASELRQSIQLLAGDIGRDSQHYAQTRIASMILREAIEHYRLENQGPVLGYAQEFFCGLTCGEYESLRVDHGDDGSPVLLGIRSGESPEVRASDMSTGTADALYLSLRLASLRYQLSHGQTLPLIIDDCLIQLDDRRAAAALQVLSQLSTHTQVILFTHHEHLLDLASKHLDENEFHLHRLESRIATSST